MRVVHFCLVRKTRKGGLCGGDADEVHNIEVVKSEAEPRRALFNSLIQPEAQAKRVDAEATEILVEGIENRVHDETVGQLKDATENQVEAIGMHLKESVTRKDVEGSKVYLQGVGNILQVIGKQVVVEGRVHMKAPAKQVDNEATGLHTSVLGNQVELKAAELAEVALQNMGTDVVSVPETPVEVEASGVHARMSSVQAGVQITKKNVEVPEKQANGEAFEIPKPRVRRIIAFPEIPAKTLETDLKVSELSSKARELYVEITGKVIGVEGIQAQGKVAERQVDPSEAHVTVRKITAMPEMTSGNLEAEDLSSELPLESRVVSQGSADSDEGDGESELEDLDSGTEDESSELLGHETDADDEEDAGDSSNSLGEVPLRDEDLQELVDHLLKVESEAAEAQEMLEEESLASLRNEVKAELGEKLSGLELDSAVEEEVNTYYEQWEEWYEDLQEQSSALQEKLEDAGVNLPDLFKGIEKQAPEGCRTEAWKQRTHWAGHQPTEEVEVVVKRAEEELKIRHPVRSQRGKLVEEGASGFLGRKLAGEVGDGGGSSTSKYELADDSGWSKVNDFLHDDEIPQPGSLMGTNRWAAVYLASTPEQAVQLGLAFPGADTVDEIGDVMSERQFKAAFANEKERGLTDQQRKSIKKVRDEDDVKRSRRVRKKEWKRLSNRLHDKTLLKETGAHLGVLGDIVQQKKSVECSLVVSSNGEPEGGINKLTEGSGSDGIHLGSDNKGTQGGASRHRSGHVNEVDENLALVIYRKGPLENGMETGSTAIELEGDFLQHDVALHAVPLGHDALVELEETSLSENRGAVMDSNRTDRADWLEEMPPVHEVVPGFELRKKRARDDEFSLKRCKRISIKDEVGISREGQKEMASVNSDSLKQDPQQPSSPSKPMLYRTTVVIDSDGEREVEEAVAESLQSYSTPSQLTGNTKHLLNSLGYAGQQVSKSEPIADAKKRKYKPSPMKEKREFPCTACGDNLKRKDVLRHPSLPVGICKHCRKHYLSGPFRKDEDGSDSECSWCGEGGKVICCDNCDKVFCQACISRNFGSAEALRVVTSDDWLCYFCNPVPLSIFTRQLAQAELESGLAKGERTEPGAIVQDAIASIGEDAFRQSKKGRHRKNIRKVLDDDELEEKQKELLAREKERQERLEQWRAAAGSTIASNPRRRKSTLAHLPETTGEDRDVINVARAENEAPVKIASSLAAVLKEHQLKGVRFMWENCIVSEKKVREGGESFGCILAHSMGLGKTLQVITFIHTVLNRNLGLTTALIVVPVNVLHNWKKEFDIWQAEVTDHVSVYMLDDSNRENSRRATLLSQWKEDGGVMLVGYSAFRNLSLGKHVKDKATRDELCQALQNPGPDLLVCDEAHMIKNNKADITQVLKQVKTRRRIALTGSPLQNNLMEYYCMVDFVREGFMGTPHVFKNRFQNPIENGQHADSTEDDVRVMKRRTYVLHKQLKGFVQRMNMSVLKDELPPKCVYVISVRLSALQRKLYTHYLQVHGLLQEDDEAMENRSQRKWLFHAYHAFAKVWNHPDLLFLAEEEEDKKQKDNVEDLVADSEEEKFDDGDFGTDVSKGKAKMSMSVRQLKKKGSAELEQLEKPLWWKGAFPEDYARENVEVSGKMVLLLRLLSMCSFKGDKALVFSQSLGTLTMIERFLEKTPLLATKGTWERDKHWYRLDGSTPSLARLQMCERFNDPSNTSAKCVLISTRAGSLGINLPAANRVIIVDGSWNPTHDLQALFRAWRLGQKKPVYAYRLLAHGTMEEKIYSRQVAKEGVAARVLDEQQVGSHFAKDDLEGLFRLEDDGDNFVAEGGKSLVPVGAPTIGTSSGALFSPFSLGSRSKSKLLDFTVPVDAPPRDDLMGSMLIVYRPRWVVSYHEHEPLLEHREEENLTSEEQKAAWESYRLEGLNGAHIIQNVITTETKITSTYTNTVVTKATAGTSSVRCTAKDHAHFMTDRKLNVRQEIICPTCLLLISWENLIGQEQQGFGHPGG